MKTRILSALIVCLIGIQANASIISSVTAISSSVTPTVETLSEGINVYHDRSPGHRMVNIPPEFNGDADVVVTSNSDKTRGDFQLEVTTDTLGILYVAPLASDLRKVRFGSMLLLSKMFCCFYIIHGVSI